MHDLVEVQLFTIERYRGCDIIHHVADADTSHRLLRPTGVIVDPIIAAELHGLAQLRDGDRLDLDEVAFRQLGAALWG